MLRIHTITSYGAERTLEIKELSDFEPVVHIFRSEKSAKGNFGSSDTQYNGEFGFDWYNSKVDGEGQSAQSSFEKITVAGNEYLVPWLILWPPKSALSKYKEIDTAFNPVNKATLCLQIDKGTSDDTSGRLKARSSNPALTINGAQEAELGERSFDDRFTINIDLTAELTKDEYIEIIAPDMRCVVGKLNVLKNNTIKIVEPAFYHVNVGNTMSQSIVDTNSGGQYNGIFKYLQQNSLNQALVYIKQPTTNHSFTINKNNLKGYNSYETPPFIDYTNDNQHYLVKELIETWYQLKTGNTITSNISSKTDPLDLTPLRNPGHKMIKKIQQSFEKHKGLPNRLALSLSENQKYIDKYQEKRSKYPEILPEPGKSPISIDDAANAYWEKSAAQGEFMFFSIPGIESLHSVHDPNTSNPGWSVNGQNTIVAFKQLLSMNGAVAHEFGHAFGLKHTFTEESKVTKIKEETVPEEADFYKKNSRIINTTLNSLKLETINIYFNSYKNQYWTIKNIELILNILHQNAGKEKSVVTKVTQSNPKATFLIEKTDNVMEKGDTLENFMDYIKTDADRKGFTIEQIQIIN